MSSVDTRDPFERMLRQALEADAERAPQLPREWMRPTTSNITDAWIDAPLVLVDADDETPARQPGRPVWILLAAAVVIAVAGIALASSNKDQSPAPVATVSVAPTTNVAPTETVAAVSPEWSVSSAEIDPRAAELDIKIVVVMPDESCGSSGSCGPASLVEYDTGSGERASISIADANSALIEAGQDWIRLENAATAAVDLYQGREHPVRIPGSDPTVRQPGTDMFWAFEGWKTPAMGPPDSQPLRVHETDIAGNETGVSFDLGLNQFLAADPAGGLVVQAPDGGTYQLDPETGASRLITTGELIALNAQTALVAACDDRSVTASCGLVVLDRLTGESHPLTPDHMPQGLGFHGEISPNNRYAPVNYRNGILGVIDLTTGQTTYLQAQGGWCWSPDGSRLVYVRDPSTTMGPIDVPIPSWNYEDTASRLLMYDFDDGAEIPIVPDSDGLKAAFAVRT